MIATRALVAAALTVAAGACDRARASGDGDGAGPRRGRVTAGDLAPRVVLTGELRATTAIELTTPRTDTWQLSIRWMAEDGELVKAGERVLEFDNSAFTSQLEQKKLLVRQAEMDLRSNRDLTAVSLADKEAEVRERSVALAKAQVLAAVPAELLAGRTAQERQLELRRAEAAVAAAELDLAAARKAAGLDLRVKQIELAKAQRGIDDATQAMGELVLMAPRDGVIVVAEHPWEGRKLHTGDTTQPGWQVITLPDLAGGLEVKAELSDVDDGKIDVGVVGSCVLDAFPDAALPCTVRSITPVARSKSRTSLRKTFDVTLALTPRAGQETRPGMSVKVELRPPPITGATLVPRGAVRVTAAGAVARLPGGATRAIELGACDAQACVVTRGLAVDEAVELGGAP
ncbi:MAG: HlyD family efflux transporter periplasmic adaptor subunit [Myxococcales bacterium]|nr:HlyD family efflux transporter periplasmic adaptor subunit [Myxococcales bacterium]